MTFKPISILFICMGNICRSPAAEAVFLHQAETRGIAHRFDVDSAGTGNWHVGKQADSRSRMEGVKRGYELVTRARQVCAADWEHFDLLIGMDEDNRQWLLDLNAPDEKIKLLTDWHTDISINEVPDPYYGGDDGFALMYDLIESAVDGLIQDLTSQKPS